VVARVAGCRLGFGGWLCLAAWLSRRVGEVPRALVEPIASSTGPMRPAALTTSLISTIAPSSTVTGNG